MGGVKPNNKNDEVCHYLKIIDMRSKPAIYGFCTEA